MSNVILKNESPPADFWCSMQIMKIKKVKILMSNSHLVLNSFHAFQIFEAHLTSLSLLFYKIFNVIIFYLSQYLANLRN